MNEEKIIYCFSQAKAQGDANMHQELGRKGANLMEMCKLGLPIPAGFTISTKLYKSYVAAGNKLSPEFRNTLKEYIVYLEEETGKKFGSVGNPLLLSVRSGSSISMPGMMETILNLGMNDKIASALEQNGADPHFIYDSYRRFLEMFGSVALGLDHNLFVDVIEAYKLNNLHKDQKSFSGADWKNIVQQYKMILNSIKRDVDIFDMFEQLVLAIAAVLNSWSSQRAVIYRKLHNISDDIGTAITIQEMVFGNKDSNSATGVIFTRNPATGEKKLFGEFLINAQGEDIVAGTRTPYSIIADDDQGAESFSMQALMPEQFAQLERICHNLEHHFADMQDIEFTIESGKLYILQTRSGKRSAASAVKIAVDMVQEGLLSKRQALLRVDPLTLGQLLHTEIEYNDDLQIIAKGLPASPGAATGIIVFSPDKAEELANHHSVILVRNDTSPEDIKGMHSSVGILTARGGMTSHAAVVARGMGKPCVCGISDIVIDEKEQVLVTAYGIRLTHGDVVTIDGSGGNVIIGESVKMRSPHFSKEFAYLLSWADDEALLKVRANAETVLDATMAIKFGAQGIGLCRTEHMFFDHEKLPLVREMIISQNYEHRQRVIENLKQKQMEDFIRLFEIMKGLPLNIRLLDPPLHEFLPTGSQEKEQLASNMGIDLWFLEHRLHALAETNPMLGHRGCRLGISHPEIYQMQMEAILGAMWHVQQNMGLECKLELMVPLISDEKELVKIKGYLDESLAMMQEKCQMKFAIKLGTMIELPRAALRADKIAPLVDYFSFGSNDLTQTTYGISRDDGASFLPDYISQGIFASDPFATIDEDGVGELIKIAIERGKSANANLSLGICGEHAGDPNSISFFHKVGLDYVSCSPYRIPIVRICVARSKILHDDYMADNMLTSDQGNKI